MHGVRRRWCLLAKFRALGDGHSDESEPLDKMPEPRSNEFRVFLADIRIAAPFGIFLYFAPIGKEPAPFAAQRFFDAGLAVKWVLK